MPCYKAPGMEFLAACKAGTFKNNDSANEVAALGGFSMNVSSTLSLPVILTLCRYCAPDDCNFMQTVEGENSLAGGDGL